MVRSNKPKVIDGFSSIQAVRHSGHVPDKPRTRPSGTKLPDPAQKQKTNEPGKSATRIGSTILPDKHDITCYQCGYEFLLTGKITTTFCPKCREQFDITNHVIDKTRSGIIRTIGTVEIKPEGLLQNTHITAGKVIIAGDARDSVINATSVLEICPGALFNMANITIKDLLIRNRSKVNIPQKVICRNLTVEGELKGRTFVCDSTVIKTNGYFKGKLITGRLLIEEGGGMSAELQIEKDIKKTTEKRRII